MSIPLAQQVEAARVQLASVGSLVGHALSHEGLTRPPGTIKIKDMEKRI